MTENSVFPIVSSRRDKVKKFVVNSVENEKNLPRVLAMGGKMGYNKEKQMPKNERMPIV